MNSRILKQTAHTAGIKLCIFAARIALVGWLAHLFAPEDYGAYAVIATINTFGVILVGLNLHNYLYRAAPGQPLERRVVIFKSTFLFEVVLSSVVVALFLGSGALGPVLRLLQAADYPHAFVTGLVLLVALVAAAEVQHYLWAKTEIEQANRMDLITQALWVLPLPVLWFLGVKIGVASVLAAQLLGVLLGIAYAFRWVERGLWWRTRPDGQVIRAALAFSLPMIVPGLSFYMLKLADRFLLAYYHGLSEAGLYSFAASLVNTLYSFSVMIIFGTMVPYVMEAHNRGDQPRRNLLLTYALKGSLVAFGVGAGLLLVLAHPILALIARPEYVASTRVLPLLMVGFFMIVAAYPAHYLLLLENRTLLLMWIDLAGLAIGLALNFLLIPHYAYTGAAVASAIGFGLVAGAKTAFSRGWRHIGWRTLFSWRPEINLLSQSIRSRRGRAAPVAVPE